MDLRHRPDLRPLFEESRRLRRLLERAATSNRVPANSQPTARLLMAAVCLAKATKSHAAILSLCGTGYGEDASVLVRTVFETAVDIRYIAETSDGEEVARRWLEFDVVNRYEMAKVVRSDPYFASHLAAGEYTEQQWDDLQAEARRAQREWGFWGEEDDEGDLKRPKHWSGHNTRELADRVGWGSHYATFYKQASGFTHSGVQSSNHYARTAPDGALHLSVQPSDNFVRQVLTTAPVYAAEVLRRWCAVAEVPASILDEVDRHDARLTALVEQSIGPERAASARAAAEVVETEAKRRAAKRSQQEQKRRKSQK